jgi:hypothetical protein
MFKIFDISKRNINKVDVFNEEKLSNEINCVSKNNKNLIPKRYL